MTAEELKSKIEDIVFEAMQHYAKSLILYPSVPDWIKVRDAATEKIMALMPNSKTEPNY